MEQRLSLVTLGVTDVARSTAFYTTLGWQPSSTSNEEVTFFPTAADIGTTTFEVVVTDDGSAAVAGAEHPGHDTAPAAPAAVHLDPDATVTDPVDPSLPPLTTLAGTTHRLTLTATEEELEVAPGVTQVRWTFDGQVPGPTLRGRCLHRSGNTRLTCSGVSGSTTASGTWR